jgi:hypothetical protein
MSVLSRVQVEALRRANPPSMESYQIPVKIHSFRQILNGKRPQDARNTATAL